jgi:hypothetical protein
LFVKDVCAISESNNGIVNHTDPDSWECWTYLKQKDDFEEAVYLISFQTNVNKFNYVWCGKFLQLTLNSGEKPIKTHDSIYKNIANFKWTISSLFTLGMEYISSF